MKSFSRFRNSSIVVCALFVGVLAGCAGSSSSLPQAAGPSQLSPQSATAQVDPYFTWRRSLTAAGLPAAGCYRASYPSNAWTPVACVKPPHVLFPLPPSASAREATSASQIVGNGADFTADVKPHVMSESIGSFPVVTGVTSVHSTPQPPFPPGGGIGGTNSYSLQLNSYFFASAACGTIKNCLAWEQFVYSNPPSGFGVLFIQDWLVPTTNNGLSGCPPNKGWQFVGGGCVQNSPLGEEISNIPIKNLASVEETGIAASTGDSTFIAVGKNVFGIKNIQSDGITDLHGHWFGSEFNVIGNGGGYIADFNHGATIEVRLEADTGLITAPTCPGGTGTTGETNNLNFVKAPTGPAKQQFPSILFKMTNLTMGGGSCDAVPAI
ncbi:MAG: hypothetical protein JO322_09215 [Candidatus Eremiobacteraeota bacterium]|nr:hypothetical protein [Candidatus Eremiobacteraeota bacterium]